MKKLPSIFYVIAFPLSIIILFGGIILLFAGLATIEGFASIIFLIIGFFVFKGIRYGADQTNSASKSAAIGGAIAFFALMGMAVDQPGNFIYNQPIEWLCPENSSLQRGVNVSNPLPGRTDITQDFSCYEQTTPESQPTITKTITIPEIIGIRFLEYIIIGYILWFLTALTPKKL